MEDSQEGTCTEMRKDERPLSCLTPFYLFFCCFLSDLVCTFTGMFQRLESGDRLGFVYKRVEGLWRGGPRGTCCVGNFTDLRAWSSGKNGGNNIFLTCSEKPL